MSSPDTKAAVFLVLLGLAMLLCCPPIGSVIGAIIIGIVAGGSREERKLL